VVNGTFRPFYPPPPGMTRYPLYRRLGRPQGRSERVLKILPPPRFDPQTVQPVASHYTDCAIPALCSSEMSEHLTITQCRIPQEGQHFSVFDWDGKPLMYGVHTPYFKHFKIILSQNLNSDYNTLHLEQSVIR
jgi:hypothetical protein